jgi:hypothetical protein
MTWLVHWQLGWIKCFAFTKPCSQHDTQFGMKFRCFRDLPAKAGYGWRWFRGFIDHLWMRDDYVRQPPDLDDGIEILDMGILKIAYQMDSSGTQAGLKRGFQFGATP